jgi:SAM-dependent methyltransferase
MNWLHRRLCASGPWRSFVRDDLLPWALAGVDLGEDALEIGPGPGVTTELLHERVKRLTCVEIDSSLAVALALRMARRNVSVLCGDATALSLPDATYDSVLCLSMLHHVRSAALQDRLFRQAARILRPNGLFVAADIRGSLAMRLLHLGEIMVPVDPSRLPERLSKAGFCEVHVDVRSRAFRVHARR